MGLGNRNAKRHETTASRHVAGVDPTVYWDFKPGQTVMTVDGFLGTVTAVNDGPHAGNEEYEVTLHNGLGGGIYRSGQLTATVDHTASENTAARDYPELAEVLRDRPDPGKYPSSTLGMIASLHTAGGVDQESCSHNYVHNAHGQCMNCGATDGDDRDEPCTRPDCKFDQYPGHSNDEHEMLEFEDEHPEYTDEYHDAQRSMDEAFPGGHPDAWLLDHQHQGPTKYSAKDMWGNPYPEGSSAGAWADMDADYGSGSDHTEPDHVAEEHAGLGGLPMADESEFSRTPDAFHGGEGHVYKNAAYYTEDQLRAEADRYLAARGITLDQAMAEIRDQQVAHFAAVGEKPGLCDQGHLTWGGDCASCRNADDGANAMVVNPGDHKPQDVENVKNASRENTNAYCPNCGGQHWYDADKHPIGSEMGCADCGKTFQITSSYHDDEDDEPQNLSHCNHCGGWRDRATGYHPGEDDGRCPNEPEDEDDVFDRLDPSKYCDENCQSAHASDIVHGIGGHHTFRVGEPEFAEHGTSRSNLSGPYDAPAERDSRYEVRDPDAEGRCHYCRKPLMGSVGDQINNIGTPAEHAFLRSNPTGPSKYSALESAERLMTEAVLDADLCFQITASWSDVRSKAKRIRSEGGVHITSTENGLVVASVKGDHATYESVLMRVPGTQKIGQWDCGCKWAKYHWGAPDDTSRFAGRMCSHALALNFEAQARGMFGREVRPDQGVPRWLNKSDVGRIASREVTPLHVLAKALYDSGVPRAEIEETLSAFGSVNSPFGEPAPSEPFAEPGPTKVRNPHDNPASAGFLTAADPESWSAAQTPSLDRMASLDDALFEPEMPHTAIAAVPEIAEALAGAGEAGAAGAGEAGAAGAGEAGAAGGGGFKMRMPKIPGMGGHGGDQGEHKILDALNQHADQAEASGNAVRDEAAGVGTEFADDFARRHQSTLHDEPEAALPSTDGAMDDEDEDDGQTWSGYAGDPDPDPHTAAVSTGIEYGVPSDVGTQSVPQQVAPGSSAIRSASDDALSPQDPSIMTQGSVADIVAEFQRTAGAAALDAGPSAADSSEIAGAARAFLQKSAMADFTPAQQKELIDEGAGGHVRASNLDRLQIEGTHYESLERALALNDNDDDSWMAD